MLSFQPQSVRSISLRSNPQPVLRFSCRTVTLVFFGFAFSLLLATHVSSVFAQGFSVESKSAPTVVKGGTFVSLEGKFSIGLPQSHNGFRGLSIDTPVGRATGDAYTWKMKEGTFSAGYVDASLSLDDPEMSKRVFASIHDGMFALARSKNGKVIGERQINFERHPALELKLEYPDGLILQRFYLISRRLYQVLLFMQTNQRAHEAVAEKVLDSFKVLSDTVVSAALKEKAAKAEPDPLPQEPVVLRSRSDAEDEGLHREVKTVFEESQDLSGTWSTQGRKPNSMKYYNERGNLTKLELYDYKGNLSDITVYGYLDGARASRRKYIEQEYNPPPMMILSPPGGLKPKYDPRYSNKFTFKYDDQKRLIEKEWISNDGQLWLRYVYKYSGNAANQREELVYAANGSLNQRYLSILDDKGNKVEQTSFETRDGSVRDKYSYTYEIDDKGNWIKRTTSKWLTKDGKSYSTPSYVDYRTITYY